MRCRTVGLDGAESEYCDLSGRALSKSQVDRTLRVFETAVALDLSNNEIDQWPRQMPLQLAMLDVSFNLLASIEGIESLQCLEELNLSFNRLNDVSLLEFCPRLQRVNLSGNRLMNTRGIETLVRLQHLDLSENLIEYPEALRPLSLNQNLTHLVLRGNPISMKLDYRVLLLDMIPSVLMLDGKKIRSTIKCQTKEGSAAKSLSYSRIYDDKKTFSVQNTSRKRVATSSHNRKRMLPNSNNPLSSSHLEGTSMFIDAHEPIQERVRSLQLQMCTNASRDSSSVSAHVGPQWPRASLAPSDRVTTVGISAPPGNGGYMSLYDRIAQANGIRNDGTDSDGTEQKAKDAAETGAQGFSRQNQSRKGSHATISPRTKGSRSAPNRRLSFTPNETPKANVHSGAATGNRALDAKQRNVLNVIQNLIQHKKQTLSTLALHQSATTLKAISTGTST